jgi:hypothetical protein
MRKFRPETALYLLLFGAMAVVGVFLLINPVSDPDFYWHLKTGSWIWQHRELPTQDPFNYMSRPGDVAGQRFTLTAYWISQVLYHVINDQWGMPGIVALKFLLALLFVVALIKLRRGDPLVHGALVLVSLLLFFRLFLFDRPQAFSFAFFAVLLIFLEKERSATTAPTGWTSWLPVPLLMLLWANMHGGHLVGQITLVLFIALEGLKFAHRALRPLRPEHYRRLLIVGIAGLAASLFNPNSYHALGIALGPALGPTQIWSKNTEYNSTLVYFREMHQPLIAIFWGALVLAAAYCLSTVRKLDITSFALLAGTGYYGFQHIRYVPFFMVAALPAIGLLLSAERVGRWGRYVLVAASLALAAVVIKDFVPTRERVSAAMSVNNEVYPARAADFVIANDLKGNLFNTYFWGGYLIWRLGPERKVFVDGRNFNMQALFEVGEISNAFALPGQYPPLWKKRLQQRGVGYIVIPRVRNYRGLILDDAEKLRQALLEAPEWVPVFADPLSLVFVLNVPEHRDVIGKYRIPKERLLGWSPGG